MTRVNVGRVIAGGVVAGIVLNIGDWLLNGVILKQDWDAAVRALGLSPTGGSQIAVFVVMDFVLGLLLVWLYAAIRPRYGAGPRTAILAGLFGWFLVFPWAYNAALPLFPGHLMTTGAIWGFFQVPIATLVGAWIYKEGGAPA